MMDRGYAFANAGSHVARLRNGAIADVRTSREGYA
jgi:hypothetical protein